nr:16S rRNA (cytidine(1402)-2'-O)-methyltransferase [Maliibacterium massiliense]
MAQNGGQLALCATPIGNMGDITLRALEALRACDVVAAEDTRQTVKLLNHYGIKKPLFAYHEHNKKGAGQALLAMLAQGKYVVLVSDAGMPGISDPGSDLVRAAAQEGHAVTLLPGACAALTALVLSGLDTSRFAFEGFLPVKGKERAAMLDVLRGERRTVILYEAPHKLLRTLQDLYAALGDRPIALARELTKLHEEVLRTRLGEAVAYYSVHAPRGEYVLVLEGASELAQDVQSDLESVVRGLLAQGLGTKGAAKEAARLLSIPTSEAYQMALRCKEN